MTTSLSVTVGLAIAAAYANSLDTGSVSYPASFNPNFVFTDGTGANQAKYLYTDTRTLGASATEDLDLAGVLTDAFGNTLTFDKIKALIITAAATNTNDVLVGGSATAQASAFFGDVTDVVKVKPGGLLALVAPNATGYDITATTADLLKLANSGAGTGVTYTIVIIGV